MDNYQHNLLWSINHSLKMLMDDIIKVSPDIQFKVVDRLLNRRNACLLEEDSSLQNLFKGIQEEIEIVKGELKDEDK